MMNRIYKFICPVLICLVAAACDQRETMLFDEEAGVYFTLNQYTYSFQNAPGKLSDTITCPVRIFGKTSPVDRIIGTELVENDTSHVNTALPEYYEVLGGSVPAHEQLGSLKVRLNYDAAQDDSVFVFHLKLVPTADFPEVKYSSKILEIQMTAQEIQPANWNAMLRWYWGSYSTRWWNFIRIATGRTSIPYWPGNPDQESWWMSDGEFNALCAIVKRELKKYNQTHTEPLTHNDGPDKGKIIEVLY